MKIQTLCSVLFSLAISLSVFAQGSIQERITVGATVIARGEIKVGEVLTTRDGQSLSPGIYRISVAMTPRGEAQFILSPFKVDKPASPVGLTSNAVKTVPESSEQTYLGARVVRNLLVKGIASNLEGTFVLENLTPSETVLAFSSRQFEANVVLGRSPETKLIDVRPTYIELTEPTDCGENCIEGYLKVSVKNDGNSPAKGKWNIISLDPRAYIGTVADIPPGEERDVVSTTKVKLPCCNPATVEVEVHADFYNNEGSDSNDYNNLKKFTLKLK